jgi:hypothetical protein
MYRVLIGIGDAQAASLFAKEVHNFVIEPGRVSELECAGSVTGDQRKKICKRRPIGAKTLGKLKKERSQFLVENRQRPEEVLGLFEHISELLHMRYDLGRFKREHKISRHLLGPGSEHALFGHVIKGIIYFYRVEAFGIEV